MHLVHGGHVTYVREWTVRNTSMNKTQARLHTVNDFFADACGSQTSSLIMAVSKKARPDINLKLRSLDPRP